MNTKNMFKGFCAFAVLLAANAMNPQTSSRPQAQLSNAQLSAMKNFSAIMNSKWNKGTQEILNKSWDDFSLSQKRAILNYMADQELIDRSEVRNWNMNLVPQPTIEMPEMQNFTFIMNNKWSKSSQEALNKSWDNFSNSQKEAILNYMVDQGVMNASDIRNWNMSRIPSKTYGR